MKKTSYRRDIVSRVSYPKEELLRFVLRDGKIVYDPSASLPGRGFYLAKENVEKAMDGKAFSRAVHRNISPDEAKEALANAR